MAKTAPSPLRIVVTGDVTIDWNLARLRQATDKGLVWNADDTTRACCQPGGAAMLAGVIETVARGVAAGGGPAHKVIGVSVPRGRIHPEDDRFHHSYAMWAPTQKSDGAPEQVWRVEEFLGLDAACAEKVPPGLSENPRRADLVVLDDAALGFRDLPELWPQAVRDRKGPAWVLMKMASPIAQGNLWNHLTASYADRMIVVMAANDLRRTEVYVSRMLSWERTAQDLFWELTQNARLGALARCAHVVVSFGTVGALWLSRKPATRVKQGRGDGWACRLLFDPKASEGMWGRKYPGAMIGYTTCLAAGIARQVMLAPAAPDIEQGIQSGVAAMRDLHINGYGPQVAGGRLCPPAFPAQRVADELARDAALLAAADVRDPVGGIVGSPQQGGGLLEGGFWTILGDLCADQGATLAAHLDAMGRLAAQIVRDGHEAPLKGVPLGEFKHLVTADRREIEGFRSVQTLLAEYCDKPNPQPLSIAVFGPPGSGKSFGVKQVAGTINKGRIEVKTFNLSQFSGADGLVDALHQVRDVALAGKVPLVFWDEFDTNLGTQKLGWLRYFLAPMQDGTFQDGQVTHPIGQAIFVFAGGRADRMEDFARVVGGGDWDQAKGPDFLSRLKGFVDIMGPDPKDVLYPAGDPCYLVRRAILLRNVARRNAPQLFSEAGGKERLNIDPGVLRAFLCTRRYKHGVRSMEAVFAMSTLRGKDAFERSCLPSEAQLNLHVDGLEFMARVQQPELEGDLLEKLAAEAHRVSCADQKGKRDAPPWARTPYARLSEDLKDQNRDNARDIPNKLATAGYVMVPARGNQPPGELAASDVERLSELEHERWLRLKVDQGFVYGPKRSKKAKTNPAILPWRELTEDQRARLDPKLAAAMGPGVLPEVEKQKDRALTRGIARILAAVGYTIVKLHGDERRTDGGKV